VGPATERPARWAVVRTTEDQSMVGYVTLGTNDLARATRFYDSLLESLGAKHLLELETFILWGTSLNNACLAITKPYDQSPATVGNGVMVALHVESKAAVDALYKKALDLGAQDEGAPGPRFEGFYAAYFRDLDGNKLNAYFLG
jgi:predicted lactoylglutathione lyase